MRQVGEISLLVSLVATGYVMVLSLGRNATWRHLRRLTNWATSIALLSLSVTMAVLVWALIARDFRFEYVEQYASRLLPWQYCLSALWVGQAGSLLLWAWMTMLLAIVLKIAPVDDSDVRDLAFGLVMGNALFLIAVMVFAADPMAPSVLVANDGGGLSPLLQHPSMLVHPPIVFLSYAAWTVPCALALAAMCLGRVDTGWTRMARPWALFAWTVLGVGLLLGAHWAYQELGWGGYWGWDPVENGSLLPWLTGTAFIHSLMAWRFRGIMKTTALALAIVTCGLCNFATFLTRSGIFSSVHAFSESPIGWMFLALMTALAASGVLLLVRQHDALRGALRFSSWTARETLVLFSSFLLLAFASVVLVGTLVAPVSKLMTGRTVLVGPEFYNAVLPPIGLGLMAMTAVVPVLRWGAPISAAGRRVLFVGVAISAVVVLGSIAIGLRRPLALAVTGLAVLTVSTLVASLTRHVLRRQTGSTAAALWNTLAVGRRTYAAYSIHLGFVCVAIGVAGSSLGTARQEFTLAEGDVVEWQGRQIRYDRLEQHQLPDKLVAEVQLEISRGGSTLAELRPARHLHLLQNVWTSEVAIHSTWGGDFYTILDAGLGEGRVAITLIDNPMMRWIWLGGCIMTVSAIVAAWPGRRRRRAGDRNFAATDDRSRCTTTLQNRIAA